MMRRRIRKIPGGRCSWAGRRALLGGVGLLLRSPLLLLPPVVRDQDSPRLPGLLDHGVLAPEVRAVDSLTQLFAQFPYSDVFHAVMVHTSHTVHTVLCVP